MTADQTFILAILAVVVTPLINYFITAQTTKAARRAALEAAAAAREAAAESRAASLASQAAVEAANHTGKKFEAVQGAIEKTLDLVTSPGNGQRVIAAAEKVVEGAALIAVDAEANKPEG